MKLELNDDQILLLLKTLGEKHVIFHLKNEPENVEIMGKLIEDCMKQAKDQGKFDICMKVFQYYKGDN